MGEYVLKTMVRNQLDKEDRAIYFFFTLKEDGTLRDGLSFNDMMLKLEPFLGILPIRMIGANCCQPETFEKMMDGLNERSLKILKDNNVSTGCYSNGMRPVPEHFVLSEDNAGLEIREDLSPENMYERHYKKWVEKYCNERYRFAL